MISDKDGMTLLYVPAGVFKMGNESGSNDEKPLHTVYLDAFWIDKTEVTNGKYAKCVKDKYCNPPSSNGSSRRNAYYDNIYFENYPVIYITVSNAEDYCIWAGRRLPAEAEWEKAARGTDARIYPWGNYIPDNRHLNSNKIEGDTTEVGNYRSGASPYGALDMAGNVWEWMADWYSDTYYTSSPPSNPSGPDSGLSRVIRGGSWIDVSSDVRSTSRDWRLPIITANNIGFRCAMSVTP